MIPGMMHLRKTHDSAAHRLPYPLYRVVVEEEDGWGQRSASHLPNPLPTLTAVSASAEGANTQTGYAEIPSGAASLHGWRVSSCVGSMISIARQPTCPRGRRAS